jgi:hypothetical protein
MIKEKSFKKTKKEQKKIGRLKPLLGVDLCACGGNNKIICDGICRKKHMNPKTGMVECGEVYQVDRPDEKLDEKRRPRRTWKYGHQKEGNENNLGKQQRRVKIERDRS